VTGLTDYYQRWVTLKYSPSGTVEWVVISNNPSPRFNFFMGPPLSIKVDDTGNFYITGFGATFKYDVSGAMVWGVERTWWNTSFTDPITVDNTGNVYVGVFLSLIKYDTENGNEIWQAPFMYELDGVIANLELDNAGQIYAAGFSMCCGGFITAKYTQIKRYVESTLGGLNTEVTFGNNVELVFTDISPGTATLIESPNGPEPPSGFQIVPLEFPVYYDITFDASYTGPITVQVPYDETTLGDFQEADLRLYHYENDILVDITTLVDTDQNIVFGETMSLSPFVLLAQEPPPGVYVEIDIKPDSDVNSINHGANGVIPVAVLTTPEFDASTVDPLSISLA
ncbi:hypothetical protein KA005_85990, partial [bacterium]|nr:hypothetical protein [bacterium]